MSLLFNGDLATGDLSQFGGWEFGGTQDGTPKLSERVTVGSVIDGYRGPAGLNVMRVVCAPGDQYGSSTGWRTVTRIPKEGAGGSPVTRDAGYDSAYAWAVLLPPDWPADANPWLGGPEWHHTGTSIAPHHFIPYRDQVWVDVFGGNDKAKTTYVSEYVLDNVEHGVWHVFCERYRHGLAPDGIYELWHAKAGGPLSKLVAKTGIGTMYQGFRNYMLFGHYREAKGTKASTIYFAGFREYATAEEALAWAASLAGSADPTPAPTPTPTPTPTPAASYVSSIRDGQVLTGRELWTVETDDPYAKTVGFYADNELIAWATVVDGEAMLSLRGLPGSSTSGGFHVLDATGAVLFRSPAIHWTVTPPQPEPVPVDAAAALASVQAGLEHLRKTTGYKAARRDNPRAFDRTEMGRAEAAFMDAVEQLGG